MRNFLQILRKTVPSTGLCGARGGGTGDNPRAVELGASPLQDFDTWNPIYAHERVILNITTKCVRLASMGRRWPGRRQAVEEEVEVRMRAADWRRTMLTAATTKAMTMRMAVMMRMAMMTMLIDEVAKAKQIFHHLYL